MQPSHEPAGSVDGEAAGYVLEETTRDGRREDALARGLSLAVLRKLIRV